MLSKSTALALSLVCAVGTAHAEIITLQCVHSYAKSGTNMVGRPVSGDDNFTDRTAVIQLDTVAGTVTGLSDYAYRFEGEDLRVTEFEFSWCDVEACGKPYTGQHGAVRIAQRHVLSRVTGAISQTMTWEYEGTRRNPAGGKTTYAIQGQCKPAPAKLF